jgi:dTDP-glucose 4,6-dehydratase
MKILVTGGAGFIGSHYVRTLLSGGYAGLEDARVTVVDKLTYAGNLANLEPVAGHPRLSFVRGDICDARLLAGVVPGHDVAINFAAESHVDRSITGASDFVASNVVGTPDSAAKAAGDLMARAYARTHGLDVSVTRCCNNYGPYQYPEKIIPLFGEHRRWWEPLKRRAARQPG